MCYDDFLAALQQYSNCQQRLGQWHAGEHQVLQTQKVSVSDSTEVWNRTTCGSVTLPSSLLSLCWSSCIPKSGLTAWITLKGLSHFRTWEVTINANRKFKYLQCLYINFSLYQSCLIPIFISYLSSDGCFSASLSQQIPMSILWTIPIDHPLQLNYLDWGIQIAWIMCSHGVIMSFVLVLPLS